jgi:Rrf2 family transcriptional regulator, nitric oxide-sensitive transcriptional repressor
MISRTVEYALRAAVHLAQVAPEPRTTGQIAEATRVPQPYLVKILQSLNRAHLVQSQRGLGGGISLAEPPEAVSILQIVNAVEPFMRIRKCPLDIASHGIRLCPLHRRLDQALASVEKAFANTTLAELLSESTGSPPLCELRPKLKKR